MVRTHPKPPTSRVCGESANTLVCRTSISGGSTRQTRQSLCKSSSWHHVLINKGCPICLLMKLRESSSPFSVTTATILARVYESLLNEIKSCVMQRRSFAGKRALLKQPELWLRSHAPSAKSPLCLPELNRNSVRNDVGLSHRIEHVIPPNVERTVKDLRIQKKPESPTIYAVFKFENAMLIVHAYVLFVLDPTRGNIATTKRAARHAHTLP